MQPVIGGSYNQSCDFIKKSKGWDYDSSSLALFSAMTVQPNDIHKGFIDQLIKRLKREYNLTKDGSQWDELDVIVGLAQDATQGEQAALLNWKNQNIFNGVKVGSIWTPNQGYSKGHIKTGFIPSIHGVKFAQQNCCMFIYNRNPFTLNSPYQVGIGAYDGGVADQLFLSQVSPNYLGGVLHNSGTLNGGRNDGLISVINKGDQQALYRNGILLGYSPVTTNNLRCSKEMYVLARNNNSTADLFATSAEIAVYGFGSAKLDQLRLALALNDYMKQMQTAVW